MWEEFIVNSLVEEFSLKAWQVENTIKLVDEGSTIPFIARYRKEVTGELDDQVLRNLYDRLMYLRSLVAKKDEITRLIEEQGNLTEQIANSISKSKTLTELEDIYRPFRPKRRTRATIAKEKGLEPLSCVILEQTLSKDAFLKLAEGFIDQEKEVNSIDEAVAGAMDIIAEQVSDNPENRKAVRAKLMDSAVIITSAKKDEDSVYAMYYEFSQALKTIANHRILAVNRGEKEGFLNVKIEIDSALLLPILFTSTITNSENSYIKSILESVCEDSLSRLILPSVQNEIRNSITDDAGEAAIGIFAKNLKGLLLQPPIKSKTVLGFDPGYRTGCKTAVVDEIGKVLYTDVIYCTLPNHDKELAQKKLTTIIKSFNVDLVSIGNGTASKESEIFISGIIKSLDRKLQYIIVNEAGASVYSASQLAAEEFPEFDVSLRSAVSIARRIQDPLAELVKIEPKAIGVGQYQHDMNQKRLGEALGYVVEDCVNGVGVDLNTASPALLSYVSGINGTVSKNIVEYRSEIGRFKSRKELLKVKKLGAKAFTQCAGFLRISDGENVLDNTSVHPESYDAAKKLLTIAGYGLDDVAAGNIADINNRLAAMKVKDVAEKIGVGMPTLIDIVEALLKKGRDPRENLEQPVLSTDVMSMEDLKTDMVITGTVRNVIDFGAFVDIGVHQDGLVHISQICDKYIKHPTEVLSVGDIVKVKVIGIDVNKKRISLTMKI